MTLLLVILGSTWGLHFSIIKIASESGLGAEGIAAFTTAGVLLCLALISAGRRKWPSPTKSGLIFFAVCALLGWVLPLLIELTVARHLSAGLLTLIVSTATL